MCFYNLCRLPTKVTLRRKWQDVLDSVVGRENYALTANSVICSIHFCSDDFYVTVTGKHFLKPSAVPCVLSVSVVHNVAQ
jgi:hypothetical protein